MEIKEKDIFANLAKELEGYSERIINNRIKLEAKHSNKSIVEVYIDSKK